jgi:aspartate/methionine/tyrosine aminotransferase
MNTIAEELNRALSGTVISDLLSPLGRRFYFPRGIVAQSGEAKQQAHNINATIGIATSEGDPMYLPLIREAISGLEPRQIFPYAPTAGIPRLRELWKEEMIAKNPTLGGKETSLPVVVSGLTHGIFVLADLFAAAGDRLILPDMFWGNYRLIFEERSEALLSCFPFFNARGGLNLDALKQALAKNRGGKALLLLNFPNNPTGYSPTRAEAAAMVSLLREEAEAGSKLLVICDDAYFGLFYEEDIYPQSLFAELADLHPNILAVKVDGGTKEELVWGFRLGFLTFAGSGLRDAHYQALVQKVMGAVRSSISNSNQLTQNLMLLALESDRHQKEKARAFTLIKERYQRVREIVAGLDGPLEPLPFNSGYFMTFRVTSGSAESLRKKLLAEHGVGTISIQDNFLRVAYSSVDLDRIDELYATIVKAAREL